MQPDRTLKGKGALENKKKKKGSQGGETYMGREVGNCFPMESFPKRGREPKKVSY